MVPLLVLGPASSPEPSAQPGNLVPPQGESTTRVDPQIGTQYIAFAETLPLLVEGIYWSKAAPTTARDTDPYCITATTTAQ